MATNNAMVAHLWANGQDASGSNFFSEGPRIYSYGKHFCAAMIHEKEGNSLVLVNSNNYSNSTSKHLNYVHRAVTNLPSVSVIDPDPQSAFDHECNLNEIKEHAKTLLTKSFRARTNKGLLLELYNKAVSSFERYCEFFELDYTISRYTNEEIEALLKEERKNAVIARKKKEAQHKLEIEQWINGIIGYEKIKNSGKFKYLRLNPHNDKEVQTSDGVHFHVRFATLAWNNYIRDALLCCKAGKCPPSPIEKIKFGAFELDYINEKGTLISGCHHICKTELIRFAKSLNLNVENL